MVPFVRKLLQKDIRVCLLQLAGGGHLSDGEICVMEDHITDEYSLGQFQVWSHYHGPGVLKV
jgi:hypothetical protein